MKKPLAARIIGIAVLYCTVFFVLVILQFSNRGNFSLSAGDMTIRGRYLQAPEGVNPEGGVQEVAGGIKLFFGGLEFNLKEERGKGLTLTNAGGTVPVNPEFMILAENSARFILDGGTAITFSSFQSARGNELQINAEFAENTSEVSIPITPRRSSLVRENEHVGILYSGSRFLFSSSGREIENGKLVLSTDNAFISYRSRGTQKIFDPSDYIIAQAQNYDNVFRTWLDQSFAYWNQNAASFQSEDDIIAYCAQALQRGSYLQALAAIPREFINSSRQSYRSSPFVGGMNTAYRSLMSYESTRLGLITGLTREKSLEVFKQEHILDFLFARNNLAQANEVLNILINTSPEMLVPDYSAGLLEVFADIRRWRPSTANPIEHLTERILSLISENLNRDNENDLVYASAPDGANFEYSARLGKALVYWAETIQDTTWSAIGRSLVLSALASGNAGKNYNILNPGDYYPRATWLSDSGLWAWTVSPSVRASYINGNLNIASSFSIGMAHHLILSGVPQFIKIQIHGMDWRTDPQFEIYDSSGWVYYPQNQILVLKLRHRSTVENVRIIYVEEPPALPASESSDIAGAE